MFEYFLAAAIAILVYRELERWFSRSEWGADPYQTDPDEVQVPAERPQLEDRIMALIIQMSNERAETTAELLKLVQVLAIRSAEAEKAVHAVTSLAITPVEAVVEEQAPANNQELNWAELPKDHAKQQQSALAEALAHIQTPDGGTMVDP